MDLGYNLCVCYYTNYFDLSGHDRFLFLSLTMMLSFLIANDTARNKTGMCHLYWEVMCERNVMSIRNNQLMGDSVSDSVSLEEIDCFWDLD
jgi:hypothetical protein